MGKTQQRLTNGFVSLLVIYALSCSCAALYFNWEYARENGFAKWFLLGEIVPTARSIIWPYFAFSSGSRGTTANATVPPVSPAPSSVTQPGPGLDYSELSKLSVELHNAMESGLRPDGETRIREILKGHVAREGSYLSKSWFEQQFGGIRDLAEYKYQLGQSAILSWDSERYSVTPEFAELRSKVFNIVPGPQLSEDTQMLEAAVRHDTTTSDNEGHSYGFDREHLVSGTNHRGKQRQGLEHAMSVVLEFVR
jgi:hypothetical protein